MERCPPKMDMKGGGGGLPNRLTVNDEFYCTVMPISTIKIYDFLYVSLVEAN